MKQSDKWHLDKLICLTTPKSVLVLNFKIYTLLLYWSLSYDCNKIPELKQLTEKCVYFSLWFQSSQIFLSRQGRLETNSLVTQVGIWELKSSMSSRNQSKLGVVEVCKIPKAHPQWHTFSTNLLQWRQLGTGYSNSTQGIVLSIVNSGHDISINIIKIILHHYNQRSNSS